MSCRAVAERANNRPTQQTRRNGGGHMIRRFKGAPLALGIVVGLAALAVKPAAEPASPAEPERAVVMSGLDNPRGLAIGPEGAVYVAEAGRGGSGPCAVLNGPPGAACYGPTGAVSRLWEGRQKRVLTGLPSHNGRAVRRAGRTTFQCTVGLAPTSPSASEGRHCSARPSARAAECSARLSTRFHSAGRASWPIWQLSSRPLIPMAGLWTAIRSVCSSNPSPRLLQTRVATR